MHEGDSFSAWKKPISFANWLVRPASQFWQKESALSLHYKLATRAWVASPQTSFGGGGTWMRDERSPKDICGETRAWDACGWTFPQRSPWRQKKSDRCGEVAVSGVSFKSKGLDLGGGRRNLHVKKNFLEYQEREVQRLLQSWFKTTCIVFYNNISAGHTSLLQVYSSFFTFWLIRSLF